MDLHHLSSLLLQPHRAWSTRSAFNISPGGAGQPPAKRPERYSHRGVALHHLFWGMTAEGHRTGWGMGAQCVSPVKYLLLFTEGHIF